MFLQLIFLFFNTCKILIFSSKIRHLLLNFPSAFFLPEIDAIVIRYNEIHFLPCFALFNIHTAWKVPVFWVLLVRIFLHSDWIRRDTEYLSIFSPNAGKYGPEKLRIRTLLTQRQCLLTQTFKWLRKVWLHNINYITLIPSCRMFNEEDWIEQDLKTMMLILEDLEEMEVIINNRFK